MIGPITGEDALYNRYSPQQQAIMLQCGTIQNIEVQLKCVNTVLPGSAEKCLCTCLRKVRSSGTSKQTVPAHFKHCFLVTEDF